MEIVCFSSLFIFALKIGLQIYFIGARMLRRNFPKRKDDWIDRLEKQQLDNSRHKDREMPRSYDKRHKSKTMKNDRRSYRDR